ncbi:methyltransferase domain-containing protein [Sulfuricurvum sp.]|uniref:class I SAM-dependent methyltransferase n=2 Tax=Sulfuricurvum sp. TaxID=2025608 RepID=UPI002627CE0E|nr:methyltransferase domain-containing protein [Sulfuricurvum sp.]MDD4882988.1 methyltransferase domain-containing protein [Sulfuricurvum sp.]
MKTFTNEPMTDILSWAQKILKESDTISFEVLNPDISRGHYAGETITLDRISYLYHSYKAWSDLGELLFCRMLTPKTVSEHTVQITYEKLDLSDSFHSSEAKEEKYGTASRFAAIRKNEEPAFLSAYLRALRSVKVGEKKRILNLGINTGDEFDLIRTIVPHEKYSKIELVGIDYSESVITVARERFHEGNAIFHVHDINDLASLNLGRFDLIITIGTLQSSTLEFKSLFASLVQEYLSKEGAIILGFPNCRWMGGEMIYGAKAPNYPYSEMSILVKDIYYCKKYLQQKKFRVTLTGKDYLFLTATKIF